MNMMPYSGWTADEDATLIRRIDEGASATQIGIELGRSRNAVCGRIHRKKLKPKHNENKRAAAAAARRRSRVSFSPEEDQTIREMAAAKSSTEIGEALGRHKASVVKRARALGVVLPNVKGPKPGSVSPLKVKASKSVLIPNAIVGKKESRASDPEFEHVTPDVVADPLMVKLVDLKEGMCKFPIGDPRDEAFGFCGLDGSPYCKVHARLCFNPPESRRRAAA